MATNETILQNSVFTNYFRTLKAQSILASVQDGCKNAIYGFYGNASPPVVNKVIVDIAKSDPMEITVTDHGLVSGDEFFFDNIQGMVELEVLENTPLIVVNATGNDTFTVQIDSTQYGIYTGGGILGYENKSLNCGEADIRSIYSKIMGFKKISSDCASLVIPRNQWARAETYAPIDQSVCISPSDNTGSSHYTMNSNGDVFVCISNAGGNDSAIEPTILSFEPFRLSDRYVWQYLYSVDLVNNKFVTEDCIPVSDLCVNDGSMQWPVQQSVNYKGAILGGNPSSFDTILDDGIYDTTIIGDGFGAVVSIEVLNSRIIDVIVENSGENYTFGFAKIDQDNTIEIKLDVEKINSYGAKAFLDTVASSLMFLVEFDGTENGNFGIDVPYCSFGIATDLVEDKSREAACEDAYDMRTKIFLNTINGISNGDEVRIGNNMSFRVLGTDVNDVAIYVDSMTNSLIDNFTNLIVGNTSFNIANVEYSELQYGIAAITYFEVLDTPITRNLNQKETFRVVIDL